MKVRGVLVEILQKHPLKMQQSCFVDVASIRIIPRIKVPNLKHYIKKIHLHYFTTFPRKWPKAYL